MGAATEEADRRQADFILEMIVSAQKAVGVAIGQAQRHPLADATTKFLEVAAEALRSAEDFSRKETGSGH